MFVQLNFGYGFGGGMDIFDSLGAIIASVIIILLSIGGGLALYFTFLSDKNENKFKGFANWIYNFLNFKTLLIDNILKILYVITASYITLMSVYTLLSGLRNFIASFFISSAMLVFGNVIARLSYEFILLLILIWKNTRDINKKLGSNVAGLYTDDNLGQELNQKIEEQVQEEPSQVIEKIENQEIENDFVQQKEENQIAQGISFCRNCGTQLSEEAIFCSNCGTPKL